MSKIICYCKNVDEDTIISAIKKGAVTLGEIKRVTGACTGNQCKDLNPKGVCCSGDIKKLVDKYGGGEIKKECCGKGCCG